ncbi:hypothetical protein [Pseudomonas putida]|uniref:hypothetical protein n=1 Tax=Pseudomonas putida TaxID=303 RepID=UPI00235CF715|nr:hypothetical protein [Pseudomonas putida]GLO24225.1 hypothetical protein PPUJ21368_20530 [Pseudomonas putida]HDS0967701.1 hypothetical protein [Pseudomonas putida]
MHNQFPEVVLSVLALTALLAFAQTSKHLTVGPYSNFLSWLALPAGVAILWKLALLYGWWTIAMFVAVSLLVGTINALTVRGMGRDFLFSLQPVQGTIFAVATVAAWVVGMN